MNAQSELPVDVFGASAETQPAQPAQQQQQQQLEAEQVEQDHSKSQYLLLKSVKFVPILPQNYHLK